ASPPGENSLRLPRAETDKITNVVKHSGRNQDQAIETIQQTAVTADEFCGVFQADIALDCGEHQIAELADYAYNDPKTDQAYRIIQSRVNPNEMSDHCHERCS